MMNKYHIPKCFAKALKQNALKLEITRMFS